MEMFPRPMKEMLYIQMIEPLLEIEPSKDDYEYYIEQAVKCYLLDMNNTDASNILFIEYLYKETLSSNEILLTSVIIEIFSQLHDKRIIREKIWTEFDHADDADTFQKFYKWLNLYKTLFEAEFKLWSTIIYLYMAEKLDPKKKLWDCMQYVNFSAWDKLEALKKCPSFRGVNNIKILIAPFENRIRNAWSWHDDYEILDNNVCRLKITKKSNWEVIDTIDLTIEELQEKIKNCEKSLLIFELWLKIFLSNHPQFSKKIIITRKPKIKEVERMVFNRAKEFQLDIVKLEINKEKKTIFLEVKNKNIIMWSVWKIFSSDWFFSWVEYVKKDVKYIEQAFGLIWMIITLYEWEKFDVFLKIFNEKDSPICDLEFNKEEIDKLLHSTKENIQYPTPKKWALPTETYLLQEQTLE